mmetsp:Transcript_14488/g.21807  ORF Transcript_14488/g.21807 Transcript_14488/m.21807 type:complete len:243 (+) Transcript_14488:2925-3653(+)
MVSPCRPLRWFRKCSTTTSGVVVSSSTMPVLAIAFLMVRVSIATPISTILGTMSRITTIVRTLWSSVVSVPRSLVIVVTSVGVPPVSVIGSWPMMLPVLSATLPRPYMTVTKILWRHVRSAVRVICSCLRMWYHWGGSSGSSSRGVSVSGNSHRFRCLFLIIRVYCPAAHFAFPLGATSVSRSGLGVGSIRRLLLGRPCPRCRFGSSWTCVFFLNRCSRARIILLRVRRLPPYSSTNRNKIN